MRVILSEAKGLKMRTEIRRRYRAAAKPLRSFISLRFIQNDKNLWNLRGSGWLRNIAPAI